MKTTLIVLCLTLVSWGARAQHDHTQHAAVKTEQQAVRFKDPALEVAYNHYIRLKDALVASKSDEAKKVAMDLRKSLETVKYSKDAREATASLVTVANLDDQRKVFSTVSNAMTDLVKGGQLSAGVLYLEYCPMANGNEGGFWLSNEKEIKNPYFGDRMLRCGSVKETIQ